MATLAAAGIAAAGSVLGGVLGGKGAKSAAKKQLQGTREQIAYARENQAQQTQLNQPYLDRGNSAGDLLGTIYGLGGGGNPGLATGWLPGYDNGNFKTIAGNAPTDVDWEAYVRANPDAMAQWSNQTEDLASFGGDINKFGAFHYANDGARRDISAFRVSPEQIAQEQTAKGQQAYNIFRDTVGAPNPLEVGSTSLKDYRDSTGYDDLVKSGLGAISANAYAKGMGNSGAALKALQSKGMALADQSAQAWENRQLNRYALADDSAARWGGMFLNGLNGISATGLGALSNIAGVGNGTTGALINANQNATAAQGNASLLQGQYMSQALQGLANAGASYFGSSYGNFSPDINALNSANISGLNSYFASNPTRLQRG